MKQILRILSAVVLLSVASAPAFAQGGGGGRGNMMEQRRAMMFEGITLTDVQKAKIDTIFANTQKERQAMMQSAGDDRAAMRAKMTELNTKQNDEIKKVLETKENIEKFEANLAKMPQGRGRGGSLR